MICEFHHWWNPHNLRLHTDKCLYQPVLVVEQDINGGDEGTVAKDATSIRRKHEKPDVLHQDHSAGMWDDPQHQHHS